MQLQQPVGSALAVFNVIWKRKYSQPLFLVSLNAVTVIEPSRSWHKFRSASVRFAQKCGSEQMKIANRRP